MTWVWLDILKPGDNDPLLYMTWISGSASSGRLHLPAFDLRQELKIQDHDLHGHHVILLAVVNNYQNQESHLTVILIT